MTENKILSDLIYHQEEGALRFSDVRYILIRPETLTSLQEVLETELGPDKAGEIIYQGGFTGGKLSGEKYKETFNLNDREAAEFMCRMGGEIGWGLMRLEELDSKKQSLIVRVNHSPFGEAYNGESNSACHFIRGVFGGFGAGIFKVEVEAKEIECIHAGAPSCLITVNKRKK